MSILHTVWYETKEQAQKAALELCDKLNLDEIQEREDGCDHWIYRMIYAGHNQYRIEISESSGEFIGDLPQHFGYERGQL